ncbi:hypothetical protein [Methylobacterium sp. SD21]|uniref:hypothetical protein n=1 Tax=Methylobacterium litchii TaxID=3138810 RepID=UPI00313C363D
MKPDELDHVWQIQTQLNELARYVREFEGALSLMDFAREEWIRCVDLMSGPNFEEANERQNLVSIWQTIAARDGALTVQHIAVKMQQISSSIYNSPVLQKNVNHHTLRAATKLMDSYFPGSRDLRNAVAHQSELNKSIDATRNNSSIGSNDAAGIMNDGSAELLINEAVYDGRLIQTKDSNIFTCAINTESLSTLVDAVSRFIGGFSMPDDYFRRDC